MIRFILCTLLLVPFFLKAQSSLLVVNKGSHTVSVVNPVLKQQVATVSVGKGPHELAVSDDGKYVYVANYGVPDWGNTISVVDVLARKELRKIELGALYRPHCIIYKKDKLYFTLEANRAVARYDLANNRVDWVAGTGQDGAHMLVVTPDEKKIFLANRVSNTVTIVETGKMPGNILQMTVGKAPEGIDISPDGQQVWIGNTGDGSIDILDVAQDRKIKNIVVGKSPIRIRFTPDGKRVIVSDNAAGEVIIMNAATQTIIKRLETKDAPMGITITADGKMAFIAHGAADYISLLDMDKLIFAGSITVGKNPDGMVWIP